MFSVVMLDVVAPKGTDLEDDGNDVCVGLEGDAELPSKLQNFFRSLLKKRTNKLQQHFGPGKLFQFVKYNARSLLIRLRIKYWL